jgi:hypothetical protein
VLVALLLPTRTRQVVAVLAGVSLGLLTVVKILDLGFYSVLVRQFDLVADWGFLGDGVEFLRDSFGGWGAIGVVIGILAVAVAALVLITLSVLRLSAVAVRHRTVATRAVAVLGVGWVLCAVLGVQIVAGEPVASTSAAVLGYDHVSQVPAGLHDQKVFAKEAAVDAFRNTPGDQLLTGLRGKDVIVAFVESYGRDAVEDPQFAPQVDAVLTAGTKALRTAGFDSRSGFLTSTTLGSGSWLAHGSLLSGLKIDSQRRYDNLVTGDRLTLNRAFNRADWRTVAVMPGLKRSWPEGKFFGYDTIYGSQDVGYRGPPFSWATMTDQYALAAFQRLERGPGHPPVMAEIPLVSSHAPWAPLPSLVDWDDVGDGSIFGPIEKAGKKPDAVWRDSAQVRTEYRRSIEYTLSTLISYVQKYGDDDLVLVFLGDHQPIPLVTGPGANHDVPITIVAKDPAVLKRISGWGWDEGLKPGPTAPVWPMAAFRDRFLTAFGDAP